MHDALEDANSAVMMSQQTKDCPETRPSKHQHRRQFEATFEQRVVLLVIAAPGSLAAKCLSILTSHTLQPNKLKIYRSICCGSWLPCSGTGQSHAVGEITSVLAVQNRIVNVNESTNVIDPPMSDVMELPNATEHTILFILLTVYVSYDPNPGQPCFMASLRLYLTASLEAFRVLLDDHSSVASRSSY